MMLMMMAMDEMVDISNFLRFSEIGGNALDPLDAPKVFMH
jgi:hypothetical protein